MKKFSVLLIALFAAVIRCQETNVEENKSVTIAEESGKEKRGISLNLGSGYDGYSYPNSYSRSRGYYGGYAPMTEYGYDGVNYGIGAQNYAGGYTGSYHGNNSPYGNYPYRSGYPTSYSYYRQHNTPVNTYPYGGIGTIYPYGSSYSGTGSYGGYNSGYNGYNGANYGGYY